MRSPGKPGGVSDSLIRFTAGKAREDCPCLLRRGAVWDADNEREIVLLTNHLEFGSTTIAAIYRDRWKIELFFKALKQNLKIKSFLGTSENALRIQIWTALIALLLLKWLHHLSKAKWSLSNLASMLRLNLFTYRPLQNWLDDPFHTPPLPPEPEQLILALAEYDLPIINLPASGVTTIDVKAALETAPAAVVSHVPDFGSVSLRYQGIRSAVLAQTALGNNVLSESYLARFTAILPGVAAAQTLEGLWWSRDSGIGGFVALSNAAAEPRTVSVEALTHEGQTLPPRSFTLAPHSNQMLNWCHSLGNSPLAVMLEAFEFNTKGCWER